MEEKTWPNLQELEERLVQANKEYTCNFTKQRFNSDRSATYLSQAKLTETAVDEFCLSEESFLQANNNDINPIIYIRVA
jgi:hypothetical protein